MIRIASIAALLTSLALPSACADAVRDICEDSGQCVSDAACPVEPPNTGQKCEDGQDEGALCFYCTEGERADATQFECNGNRYVRRSNLDCDG